MSQAEAIKQYLKVRDLQTKDTSAQEEEDDQRFLCECMHAVFKSQSELREYVHDCTMGSIEKRVQQANITTV